MLQLLHEHRQRRKVRVFRDKLMNSCIWYLLRLFINFFFSLNRVNRSSHSAGSFTSPLLPQIKDSLLLLLLKTCASKPPSPTPLSPPLKRATPRVEDTARAGATPGWAAPPRLRAASPAIPSPDRSSPAGTCLLYSGPRELSSPPSSWASSRGRMDPPLQEPPAPGCPTSTTWRRRRCNPTPNHTTSNTSPSWKHLPVHHGTVVKVYMKAYFTGSSPLQKHSFIWRSRLWNPQRLDIDRPNTNTSNCAVWGFKDRKESAPTRDASTVSVVCYSLST